MAKKTWNDIAFECYEETIKRKRVDFWGFEKAASQEMNGSYRKAAKLFEQRVGQRISHEWLRQKVLDYINKHDRQREIYQNFTSNTRAFLLRNQVNDVNSLMKKSNVWFKKRGATAVFLKKMARFRDDILNEKIKVESFTPTEEDKNRRYVVIGDLHGHYHEFMFLYNRILTEWNINPEEDIFVFLGDYVDGGYYTRNLISKLAEWRKKYQHWVFLYGNHEDLLVNAYNSPHEYTDDFRLWYEQGGKATLRSYCNESLHYGPFLNRDLRHNLIPFHYRFITENLELYYETPYYYFVHAGLNPYKWDGKIENQTKENLLWIREPFLSSKVDFGKKVIFGHTSMKKPLFMPNKIGVDTFIYHDNGLTALLLPEEKTLFQPTLTRELPI